MLELVSEGLSLMTRLDRSSNKSIQAATLADHKLTIIAAPCMAICMIAILLLGLSTVIIANDFIRNIQYLKLPRRPPPRHLAHRWMPRIQALGMFSPERNLETPFAGFIAAATCTTGWPTFVAFALLSSAIETS